MNTKNQKPLGWYVETIKENYDWCSFDTVVKMVKFIVTFLYVILLQIRRKIKTASSK